MEVVKTADDRVEKAHENEVQTDDRGTLEMEADTIKSPTKQ